MHGFTSHCANEPYLTWADRIGGKFNLVTCGVDFRHHGKSEDRVFTGGEAENWDIRATLDEADKHDSPKPYILIGDSLGAMAAQRTAIDDSRVSGAILIHPPCWPWDAVGKMIDVNLSLFLEGWVKAKYGVTTSVGTLINMSYGTDILKAGDIRCYNGHPAHNPRILYIMGNNDIFDIWKTKEIYDHWFNGKPATFNVWPGEKPDEQKWFVKVEGAVHPSDKDEYVVWKWEHFNTVIDQFLGIVLGNPA